jgi:outer membrane immunogenic protein
MKRVLLTATAFVFATGAYAADMTSAPSSMMSHKSVYNWSGAYIGVDAGYLWGSADHTFSQGGVTNTTLSGSSDPDGFIGGVYAGYNWQSGPVVFGVETDFEGGSVDGSFVNNAGATSAGTSSLNWQGSLRARIGYAERNMLFYGTGGWAYGDFDFGGGPAFAPVTNGYSDTMSGWTLGAGMEMMFTQNWIGRLEYRYTDFGTANGPVSPAYSFINMPVDVTTSAIRAGFSYKF